MNEENRLAEAVIYSTSRETRRAYPISSRVATQYNGLMKVNQEVRYGKVVGYCSGMGSEDYIRVTWDGWHPTSTVAVHKDHIERVSGSDRRTYEFIVEMSVTLDDQTEPESMVYIIQQVLSGERLADWKSAVEDTVPEYRPQWRVKVRN